MFSFVLEETLTLAGCLGDQDSSFQVPGLGIAKRIQYLNLKIIAKFIRRLSRSLSWYVAVAPGASNRLLSLEQWF